MTNTLPAFLQINVIIYVQWLTWPAFLQVDNIIYV